MDVLVGSVCITAADILIALTITDSMLRTDGDKAGKRMQSQRG